MKATPDSNANKIMKETPDSKSNKIMKETPDSNSNKIMEETPDSNLNKIMKEIPDSNSDKIMKETPDSNSNELTKQTLSNDSETNETPDSSGNDIKKVIANVKDVGEITQMDIQEINPIKEIPIVSNVVENVSKQSIQHSANDFNNEVTKASNDINNATSGNVDVESNESGLKCTVCGTLSCVMWRKLDREHLICNICHLKRIKNATIQNGSIVVKNTAYNSNVSNKPNKDMQSVRISNRKNKAKKKFPSAFYSDRIIKAGNNKNRRNLFKKKPLKGAEGGGALVASTSIIHNGLLYQVGDIVCTCDLDGGTYFAQIRGFLQDDYCEKSVVVTWLIPLKPGQHTFDPVMFVPGLDEEKTRSMACFDFVCRAPNDLYKSRLLHPPLQRSQANLENLIAAAHSIHKDVTMET